MDGLLAVDFGLAREVVQRGVAALFAIAFLSTLNQFPALLGERGLLPAPHLLERAHAAGTAGWMLRPTLFRWVRYTDRRLRMLCVGGIALALLLVAGLPQQGPEWVPLVCFWALWLGYMSVTSIGQVFYGFGWEMLLLEAGFLAGLLGSAAHPPPTVSIVLVWWLVFRLEFGAGMIKIRGGSQWRDLTALMYHHQTQPMPGPLSRRAHLLPAWFHRLEVLGNHFSQLVVPWFLFTPLLSLWVPGPVPAIIGAAAAAVIIVTQLWLVLTGNFAWLNAATIVLACAGIAVPTHTSSVSAPPLRWLVVTAAVALVYAWLSRRAVANLFAHRQLMNASFNRWQLANAYGAFGTVTTERIEYVIEGTRDTDPDRASWHEYTFRGKPGDPSRRPRQVAPYHLRLDWLMWFLPLGQPLHGWFETLLLRLLEADAPTLHLLAGDPFEGEAPQWVRVLSYRYRFTTTAQHRRTRTVWVRDRRRVIVGPVSRPGPG